MNKYIIKIMLPIFLLFAFKVDSYQDFICSLQCTGKTCGKDMDTLNSCVNNCSSTEYQPCWINGLEALNRSPNLNLQNREKLISLLKRAMKKSGKRDVVGKYPVHGRSKMSKRTSMDQDTALDNEE